MSGKGKISKERVLWLAVSTSILTVAAVWGLTAVRQSDSSPPVIRTGPIEKGDLVLSIPATGLVVDKYQNPKGNITLGFFLWCNSVAKEHLHMPRG